MTIKFNNHKIEYEKYRGHHIPKLFRKLTGRNTSLLFLPGFATNSKHYPHILSRIAAAGIDTFILDWPGHGNSEFIPEMQFSDMAKIVEKLVRTIGLSNVTLVGYSMGGSAALSVASSNPDWLYRTIGIAPLAYPLKDDEGKTELGLVKNQAQLIEKSLRNNPGKPLPEYENIAKIGPTYRNILADWEIDYKRIRSPLRIILMNDDKIINNNLVKQKTDVVSDVKYSVLTGFNHDLYFLTQTELYKLTKSLITYV